MYMYIYTYIYKKNSYIYLYIYIYICLSLYLCLHLVLRFAVYGLRPVSCGGPAYLAPFPGWPRRAWNQYICAWPEGARGVLTYVSLETYLNFINPEFDLFFRQVVFR